MDRLACERPKDNTMVQTRNSRPASFRAAPSTPPCRRPDSEPMVYFNSGVLIVDFLLRSKLLKSNVCTPGFSNDRML